MKIKKLKLKTIDDFDKKYTLVSEYSLLDPKPFEESGRFETYGADKEFIIQNYKFGQQWSFTGETQVPGLKEDAVFFEVTNEVVGDSRNEKYYLLKDDFINYLSRDEFLKTSILELIEYHFKSKIHGKTSDEVEWFVLYNLSLEFETEYQLAHEFIGRTLTDTEKEAFREEVSLFVVEEKIIFNNDVAIGYKDSNGNSVDIFN